VHILSYENEYHLHVNKNSFEYERLSTKTRFEKEAQDNSEMAYQQYLACRTIAKYTEEFLKNNN